MTVINPELHAGTYFIRICASLSPRMVLGSWVLVTYPCIMKPGTSHLTGRGLTIAVGLKDREPGIRNMIPEYFVDILVINVWNLRMK